MPSYHFDVHDGKTYDIRTGANLANDTAALAEAAQIVRELKADNSRQCSHWLIEVKEGRRLVDSIEFWSVQS